MLFTQGWSNCKDQPLHGAQWCLTQEVELLGEDVKEDAGVHGEEDGEVSPQGAPHKEMVNSRPVARVQRDLQAHHNA